MPIELEYLAAVVLLPLIPALALYRLLPSEAWVDGPLKGWKIHLTGAFAAYFALFLGIIPIAYNQMKPLRDRIDALEAENMRLKDQYQTWTVELDRTGLDKIGNNPFNRLINVVIRPPDTQPSEDGFLRFPLVVQRNGLGDLEFPTLTLTYTPPTGGGAYQDRTIDLTREQIGQEYTLRRVDAARTIRIVGALPLKKRPVYQPQSNPQPVN